MVLPGVLRPKNSLSRFPVSFSDTYFFSQTSRSHYFSPSIKGFPTRKHETYLVMLTHQKHYPVRQAKSIPMQKHSVKNALKTIPLTLLTFLKYPLQENHEPQTWGNVHETSAGNVQTAAQTCSDRIGLDRHGVHGSCPLYH